MKYSSYYICLILFFVVSCKKQCDEFMTIDKGDACVVIYSLSKLNAERSKKGQENLTCDLKKEAKLNLPSFKVRNPRGRELKNIDPYHFVSIKQKNKSSFIGKGFCSDVYLVKGKESQNIKVLKYNRGSCGSFHEDKDFFDIMCAVTNNPVQVDILSKNLMVTSYIQGETLHQHLLDGSFFANSHQMKDKMKTLLKKMISRSLLYRDIHSFNFIFDQNKKDWVIIDSHYPLLFNSPSIALKYVQRGLWDHKDFSPQLKKELILFFNSL